MKILALETSGVAADVALLDADAGEPRIVGMQSLPGKPRTAQTLAPAIQALLQQAGWRPKEIDLVAVATGPGSFTGLRLGVTTAKVIAYAAGAQVHGVNTLEVIAQNALPLLQEDATVTRVRTALDAQRNQVYAASFDAAVILNAEKCSSETQILDDQAWLESLQPGDLLVGPGLSKFKDALAGDQRLNAVISAPQELWQPTALAVGQLAWREIQSGKASDDVWSLRPQYYRQSAAEEKRAQLEAE